jgi:hypothetical protein
LTIEPLRGPPSAGRLPDAESADFRLTASRPSNRFREFLQRRAAEKTALFWDVDGHSRSQ